MNTELQKRKKYKKKIISVDNTLKKLSQLPQKVGKTGRNERGLEK
jgi:hypothetical protein